MSFKSIGLTDDLHAYLVAHNRPPDPLNDELVAQTRSVTAERAVIQIAPEQATLPTLLLGDGEPEVFCTLTRTPLSTPARGRWSFVRNADPSQMTAALTDHAVAEAADRNAIAVARGKTEPTPIPR